jgi:S1-C subfamily serine protease
MAAGLVLAAVLWFRPPGGIASRGNASRGDLPSVAQPAAPQTPLAAAADEGSPPRPQSALASASAAEFPIGTAVQPISVRGFEGWLQSFETAKQRAAAARHDIVLVFGCSDTQPATRQLAEALQRPDCAAALENLERVVVDFPQTTAGYEWVEDASQNQQLFDQFGLQRLPALALADNLGRPYWLVRNWDAGFDGLASQLATWRAKKGERDERLAAAERGTAESQLAAAVQAAEWIETADVWTFYGREIAGWWNLAEQRDAENARGMLEVFFEPQWLFRAREIMRGDALAAREVAQLLEPWMVRRFRDADRGARLHLLAGRLLQSSEQPELASRHLAAAASYRPSDSTLAQTVDNVRQVLANAGVRGGGTGFLVSAEGYVLTSQHVIAGGGTIDVRFAGDASALPAQLIAHDAARDLALLKVPLPAMGAPPVLALRSAAVRRGAAVASLGFPLRSALGTALKFTAGTISAVPDDANQRLYLLDMTINPGNSGGPLCDRRGNVVGMISAKTGGTGQQDSYGLAIPAADLKTFLDEHLPAAASRASPDETEGELAWDKVDERVSGGVALIALRQ